MIRKFMLMAMALAFTTLSADEEVLDVQVTEEVTQDVQKEEVPAEVVTSDEVVCDEGACSDSDVVSAE